jgi:hypothetical protein
MKKALWISLLMAIGACNTDDPQPPAAQEPAASVSEDIVIGPIGPRQCGSNTCGAGTYCCNASCGVCAPFGAQCLDVYCAATDSLPPGEAEELIIGPGGGQQCGYVTCGAKQHCCNASCSQCVPFGMECTQQTCD